MSTDESEAVQAIDGKGIKARKPVGRPSTFNLATAAIICDRLAGGETLTRICKTPGIPARQTVQIWRRKHPAFDVDYRAARVDQMHAWGDDCLEISDDDSLDTMQTTDKQGNIITVANHANVQRDRLRVSTRQFLMAKLAPLVYGDRVAHEHGGTIDHAVTVQLSDRERMRRLATFMLEDRQAGRTIDGSVLPAEPAPAQVQAPEPKTKD